MEQVRFDGQVAVISGAGRGLGRAHALLLAARGAKVVVNDLGTEIRGGGSSQEPANAVADEIRAAGGEAIPHFGDVADPEGPSAVEAAVAEYGRVDIVISNAGYSKYVAFGESSIDDLQHLLRLHVHGAYNLCRAAWPHFVGQGYGRIVLTTSSAGLYGTFDRVPYSTAKMALVGMTKSLAIDGADAGIRANAVAPAAFTRLSANGAVPEMREKMEREGRPELVSPVFAWLAHPDCPVTGETFHVSAGRVSHVFVGETAGYVDPELTVEDVRDHWAELNDAEGHLVPANSYASQFEAMRIAREATV